MDSTFGFPADRFRILGHAAENQLKAVRIEVNGHALRWEALDEDLTAAGLLLENFNCRYPGRPLEYRSTMGFAGSH